MTLELALAAQQLDDRDDSQVRRAAEIFLREEVRLPIALMIHGGIDGLYQVRRSLEARAE
jgi:hypothetical protein